MITPPPDMYPGCTWADQPVTATAAAPLDHIGTAATVDPRTGLTTRYKIWAYDPAARTLRIAPDSKEDRAGVVRPFPAGQRAQARTVTVADMDDVRLIHHRDRADLTALHTPRCRHAIKAAFTAGGDRGVPRNRRVYRFRMETTAGNTCRFLVHAPTQSQAEHTARLWWQGTSTADGRKDSRLPDGEQIHLLTYEGARDMHWPYPDPIADPA